MSGQRSGRPRSSPPSSSLPATTSPRLRGRAALAILLLAFGVGGVGWGLTGSSEPPAPGPSQRGAPEPATGSSDARGAVEAILVRSVPLRLDVPSVGIHTDLMKLRLNSDKTLEVPDSPMLAGWYTGSPTPGEQGPSVIAGHVDSRETGPAVFYRLGEIAIGDRIRIGRTDGSIVIFDVLAVRVYSKSAFPTQTVYGNTQQATLRLITCGDWNDETNKYDGNVVVFARLLTPASG